MLRHPGYTRTRIAQVGERIRALIYAEACNPDRLMVSGPVGRIALAEAEALGLSRRKAGRAVRAAVGDLLVPGRGDGAPEWAGERVDLLWVTHSEATLWVDGRAVQGLNTSRDGPAARRAAARARRAAASGSTCGSSWPATASSAGSTRPYATRRAGGARPLPDRPLRPAGVASCTTTSTCCAGWRPTPRNGLDPTWAGELLAELNRVCNVVGRGRPRDLGRGGGDPAAGCCCAATASSCTSCRRSATPTSTPPGCGRWRRRTARLVRTFSSQTAYMERYPEFRFCCSQA